MKCTIDENGLKTWSRAIHMLTGLGDTEIHFLLTPNTLTLTSFDSSLSVCCALAFHDKFFREYTIEGLVDSELSCRLPSKCLLKPFRSLRFLTKFTHSCELILRTGTDYLRVLFTTKGGSQVYYDLAVIPEVDALSMDFDHSTLLNTLSSDPKLLLGSLSNFNYSKASSHLTLKASGNKLYLRNSATDLVKKEGKVVTELSLNPIDFTHYSIQVDGELTISMREFRTFISFAENMKLQSISVLFQTSTDPVVVIAKSDTDSFQAILTLATKTMREVNNTHGALSQSILTNGSNVSISNPSLSNDPKRGQRQVAAKTRKKPPEAQAKFGSNPNHDSPRNVDPAPSTSNGVSIYNEEALRIVEHRGASNPSGENSSSNNQPRSSPNQNNVDPVRVEQEMENLDIWDRMDLDLPNNMDERPSPPLSPEIEFRSSRRKNSSPSFIPFLKIANGSSNPPVNKRRKVTSDSDSELRIRFNPLNSVPGAEDVLAEDSDKDSD